MKKVLFIVLGFVLLQSCVSKKEVLYFQNAKMDQEAQVSLKSPTIQPNDILTVKISALNPEAAASYNFQDTGNTNLTSIEMIKIQGYLVSNEFTIELPELGTINVKDKSVTELSEYIKQLLLSRDELKNPSVNVRIINAKVTVLGEVRAPGTYTFTEQSITLPQALGYAGDLTINGDRKDVTIIREENGKRVVHHIDMTTVDWFDSPYYYIRQNDFIVVNPNAAKVKSAGIIGNAGTVLSIVSILLSTIVIISR